MGSKPMDALVLLVLALVGGEPPASVPAVPRRGITAGESCPPAHDQSAERVRTLLSSPLLPQMRTRFNLGTASALDVHLLTNPRDGAACRALWEALESAGTHLGAGDRVSFYRSGDTYFVPISRSRRPGKPGAIQLDGYSSLEVYDPALRLVGRFGA